MVILWPISFALHLTFTNYFDCLVYPDPPKKLKLCIKVLKIDLGPWKTKLSFSLPPGENFWSALDKGG